VRGLVSHTTPLFKSAAELRLVRRGHHGTFAATKRRCGRGRRCNSAADLNNGVVCDTRPRTKVPPGCSNTPWRIHRDGRTCVPGLSGLCRGTMPNGGKEI